MKLISGKMLTDKKKNHGILVVSYVTKSGKKVLGEKLFVCLIGSLRTHTYFRRNQVTAGNMSSFTGYFFGYLSMIFNYFICPFDFLFKEKSV